MTITGAINRVDGIKPNGFRLEEKIRWLFREKVFRRLRDLAWDRIEL